MEFVSIANSLCINLLSIHMHTRNSYSDYYQFQQNKTVESNYYFCYYKFFIVVLNPFHSLRIHRKSKIVATQTQNMGKKKDDILTCCCCSITSCLSFFSFFTNETTNNTTFMRRLIHSRINYTSYAHNIFISFYYCCEIKHRPFWLCCDVRAYDYY